MRLEDVDRRCKKHLAKLEALQGQKLGKATTRCCERAFGREFPSRMMDTILNLGSTTKASKPGKRHQQPALAYDSYRRLIQMFATSCSTSEKSVFEEIFDAKKHQRRPSSTPALTEGAARVIVDYKKRQEHAKRDFPQEPSSSW